MSDLSITWQGTRGDFALLGADLQSGQDLSTAIVRSLFTDRRAELDDTVPDGSGDRRGWWGDADGQLLGSRLWLLERAKRTQETLQSAKGYIEEALQWLIDDGVVATFEIDVEWPPGAQLSARVVAVKTDGEQQSMRFAWAWDSSLSRASEVNVTIMPLRARRLDGRWNLDGSETLSGYKYL